MNTIYFDHNILDRMLKGAEPAVVNFIEKHNLEPIWSDENIQEIIKSQGKEYEFCELLVRLKAQRIFEEYVEFKSTGHILLEVKNPHERLAELKELKCEEASDGKEFLEKFVGGRADLTFLDALVNPLLEQKVALEKMLSDFRKGNSYLSTDQIQELEGSLEKIPDLIEQLTLQANELDERANSSSLINQIEEFSGVGPVQLNNIKPPKVVEKIWGLVGHCFGAPKTTLEQWFGLEPLPIQGPPPVPIVLSGKVNAIYHQLNMLGYWRDSKLNKSSRFNASWSDMVHAGMASFSTVFLCNDKAMRLKTKAAYEYLEIDVLVVGVVEERQEAGGPESYFDT